MKKLHPETETNNTMSNQKFEDIREVENGEFFWTQEINDPSVAFIVIIYKDGSRVTKLQDQNGDLLQIAGDIRDTKQKIDTALNNTDFYINQSKKVETN